MSNQWLSVKDNLPDIGTYCLVLDHDGCVDFAVYVYDLEDGDTPESRYFCSINPPICDNHGYDNDGQYGEIINITHWALMPQLPNIGDNN